MSSLDFDFDFNFDGRLYELEREWRGAIEASMIARAYYEAVAVESETDFEVLGEASEALERSEVLKSQIMTKIDRLKLRVLGLS